MTKRFPYEKLKEFNSYSKISATDNSEIFEINKGKLDSFVIKFLKKINNKEKRQRFLDEITIVCNNLDCRSILPIIDSVDIGGSPTELWYTMPLAKPISDIRLGLYGKFNRLLKEIYLFAVALVDLHSKNIFHRDIKPANLFIYDKRCVFGDFGLVDYPDKPENTKNDERLGNYLTIAPEAKYVKKHRNESIDWEKVDVYAFAKTAWMILTESKVCFDGQYDEDDSMISLDRYYEDEYLVELNYLLSISTDNNPNNRPSSQEFLESLISYMNCRKNFTACNLIEWKHMSNKLFGNIVPSCAVYEDKQKIIDVLNCLSKHQINHVFFEDGGGMTLRGAQLAKEQDCIEFDFGYIMIGKTAKLIFNNIEDRNCAFNYVEVQFDDISPIYDCYGEYTEDIYVATDGEYIRFNYGENGYDNYGNELQKGTRKAVRRLNGKIVIFPFKSVYNQLSTTYDGRHKNYSSNEYRQYIIQMKSDFEIMEIDEFLAKYNVSEV